MAVWIAILLATIQRKFCIKILTWYHTLGWVRIFVFMTSLRGSTRYESLSNHSRFYFEYLCTSSKSIREKIQLKIEARIELVSFNSVCLCKRFLNAVNIWVLTIRASR